MERYTAYGLTIASDLPLPELAPAASDSADPDVTVRVGRVDVCGATAEREPIPIWATRTDARLSYAEAATFRIRGGCEIQIERFSGADERAVRLLLLGPALAVLLHQRGLLVLHASAVAFGASVIAFVGDKGEGKSTLAAALHARGHPLVADDLVAIRLDCSSTALVRPGFPQLKLGPDVLAQLGENPEALPKLHPDYEKRARRVNAMACDTHLTLARLYVLESGIAEAIEPLPVQQRFIEMVRHSYVAELLQMTGESEAHFKQVVALASRLPVCRLRRRRDLMVLSDTAALVEAEFNGT